MWTNYLTEMLSFIYYGLIVNNWPKNKYYINISVFLQKSALPGAMLSGALGWFNFGFPEFLNIWFIFFFSYYFNLCNSFYSLQIVFTDRILIVFLLLFYRSQGFNKQLSCPKLHDLRKTFPMRYHISVHDLMSLLDTSIFDTKRAT